jgi:hypothetical protein
MIDEQAAKILFCHAERALSGVSHPFYGSTRPKFYATEIAKLTIELPSTRGQDYEIHLY